MGWIEDLLGIGSKANTTTTTSTPSVPPDVEAARKDLLARAQAFAAEPYPEYKTESGQAIPRVAQFTEDQLKSFENVRDIANVTGGLADLIPGLTRSGIQATTGLAKTLPEADIQAYMSPYTQGVIDPMLRAIEENAARQRLSLGQQSARTGSFGGSRQAIAESELGRNTQRNVAETTANERAKAYNQALDQFRKDQELIPKMYSAAQNQLSTGMQQNTGRLATEFSPLLQTGTAQQALDQANLDVLRKEFEEQRDYPLRGMEALRGALGLGATTLGIGSTGTSASPGPNVLGSVLGTVAAAPKIISGANAIWNWLPSFGSSSGS
jgi:hypothetical protein